MQLNIKEELLLNQMDLIQNLESNARFVNITMWLDMGIKGIFTSTTEEQQYYLWCQQLSKAQEELLKMINDIKDGIELKRKRSRNGI